MKFAPKTPKKCQTTKKKMKINFVMSPAHKSNSRVMSRLSSHGKLQKPQIKFEDYDFKPTLSYKTIEMTRLKKKKEPVHQKLHKEETEHSQRR